jgi:hypothetical protein
MAISESSDLEELMEIATYLEEAESKRERRLVIWKRLHNKGWNNADLARASRVGRALVGRYIKKDQNSKYV